MTSSMGRSYSRLLPASTTQTDARKPMGSDLSLEKHLVCIIDIAPQIIKLILVPEEERASAKRIPSSTTATGDKRSQVNETTVQHQPGESQDRSTNNESSIAPGIKVKHRRQSHVAKKDEEANTPREPVKAAPSKARGASTLRPAWSQYIITDAQNQITLRRLTCALLPLHPPSRALRTRLLRQNRPRSDDRPRSVTPMLPKRTMRDVKRTIRWKACHEPALLLLRCPEV